MSHEEPNYFASHTTSESHDQWAARQNELQDLVGHTITEQYDLMSNTT